jgi:uncharacterized membrane protein YfcA
MVFETAGIEVALWVPPLVGALLSLVCSTGGVSGAFLLLPFQMTFLGYTSPSVSATNQLFNVVGIPSGVYRYYREGRLVWPLSLVVIIGTLPGVFIGAFVRVVYLPEPGTFKLFAAGVLGYIGFRMVQNLVRTTRGSAGDASAEERFQSRVRTHRERAAERRARGEEPLPATRILELSPSVIAYEFYGETFRVPTLAVLSLSLAVGIVGGMYGIGGGAIMAPFFVSVFGLPIYTVAGAALLGTFVTSVAGVLFYTAIAPFFPGASVAPDWLLGLLFGLGGMVGMYAGARIQKRVPARAIKWMLAVIIGFTAGKYILGFFVG